MVTCHGCKSVLMIDISGHVSQGSVDMEQDPDGGYNENTDQSFDPLEAEGLSEEATHFDSDSTESEYQESIEVSDGDLTEEFEESEGSEYSDEGMTASSGAESDEYESDDIDITDEQDFDDDEPINEFFADRANEQTDSAEETHFEAAGNQGDEDYEEEIETFPLASQPDPNPVDITEFANSEESSLEDGDLLYDLIIGRLDSKDLKDSLKYVLMDEKLKLNHLSYLKKIKGGKLLIPDLNPIKAKRIVEQLQYLDLDIKWKQKRVIMEAVEPELDDEGDIIEDAEI